MFSKITDILSIMEFEEFGDLCVCDIRVIPKIVERVGILYIGIIVPFLDGRKVEGKFWVIAFFFKGRVLKSIEGFFIR